MGPGGSHPGHPGVHPGHPAHMGGGQMRPGQYHDPNMAPHPQQQVCPKNKLPSKRCNVVVINGLDHYFLLTSPLFGYSMVTWTITIWEAHHTRVLPVCQTDTIPCLPSSPGQCLPMTNSHISHLQQAHRRVKVTLTTLIFSVNSKCHLSSTATNNRWGRLSCKAFSWS